MKKILEITFILLFLCLFTVGCGKNKEPMDLLDSIQQRGILVVGVSSDIVPFGYKNANNEYEGFEIDLAKQIAKLLLYDENKIEFVSVEPANRIMMLNSGQADMIIATMTITPKRMNVVDFSNSYYNAGQTALVNDKSKIKSLSDLANKKVGVAFGTTAFDGIKEVVPTANLVGFKTYQQAINALKAEEIDAFALDDTILIGYAMKDKSLRMLNQRYTQEPYGIAFRKGIESARTLELVNNFLVVLNSTGTLNAMKNKWIK
ncbi:transporter substrate-binding domain-containing protein [bacterium]|nr:transporter substrate-binding domain-containing protein [bacterium]